MNLILKYFNVNLHWEGDKPIISIKLLDKFLNSRTTKPIRPNGIQPYSTSQIEYFNHYLGDKIGKIVYDEYKRLFPKTKRIEWYIHTFNPVSEISERLISYSNSIGKKVSDSLRKHYNSPAADITRQKYRERDLIWKNINRKKISDKWKDLEWRNCELQRRKNTGQYVKASETNKKRMSDPEYVERFMLAVRNPERRRKISNANKLRWQKWINSNNPEDIRKVNNIITSSYNKVYNFDGVMMNSIEYLMASYLKELNIKFEYENVYTFKNYTFKPDFYLPEYNIVIECYGDYWHANPKNFKQTDTICERNVADIWKRDLLRQKCFTSNGFTFMYFWGNELKNNQTKIKNELLCKIQTISKKN